MIVLPALVVSRYDFTLEDKGIILSEKLSIIIAKVGIDATYPAHTSPAPRADNICRSGNGCNFEPE